MRSLLLTATLLIGALIALAGPATAQDRASAAQCRFEGTWRAQGFTTRIDAQRRWATWSGNSTQGPPAVQGWVLTDDELMTFDYDGAEHGYAYAWIFEDNCAVLDLHLVRQGGRPNETGVHLRFSRLR
ncbi:MAG: hypothetical protein ACI9KE_000415 [Polyangiales bacterium]|jgi:hypothetical protein